MDAPVAESVIANARLFICTLQTVAGFGVYEIPGGGVRVAAAGYV
jgi:hypothetical protein